jgi:hypothetical protein
MRFFILLVVAAVLFCSFYFFNWKVRQNKFINKGEVTVTIKRNQNTTNTLKTTVKNTVDKVYSTVTDTTNK